MTKPQLLILGAREMQRAAFDTAREHGIETVAIDPDTNAACRSLADRFYVADLADLDTLERIARETRIDGVMTLAADYPVLAVSHLCEALGLPGPSIEAVRNVCDKGRLRRTLAQTRLAGPEFEIFSSVDEVARSELFSRSDCIVKPIDSSGGRGVYLLARGATAEAIRAAAATATSHSRGRGVIVEEFIDGPEFSVEAFTIDGCTRIVAITEKLTSGPPYFLEIGHVVPADLDAAEATKLEQFVTDLVKAIGLDNTASHTELKLTSNGPALIEVAARLGGGFINTDLVPLATGVDMVAASIDIALGRQPELLHTRNRAAAIRFLVPPAGRYVAIDGLESVSISEGVHRIVCDYQCGEEIRTVRDATGRKCYVICHAPSLTEAKTAIEQASSRISFRVQNDA